MTIVTPDIFTEPDFDPDTLRHLGPLRPLAGTWIGEHGVDVHPTAAGPREDAFVERYELTPIDPQTNGPQLLYGLRYHSHITRPGEVAMFHEQVGYWLWEPATGTVLLTLAIPRGQVAMASGLAAPGATSFTVRSERGSTTAGIVSNPFLERAFRTTAFEMTVTTDAEAWSYTQTTRLEVLGRDGVFLHTDRNRLRRVATAAPNPLGRAATAVRA
jgi:hypothetical protein